MSHLRKCDFWGPKGLLSLFPDLGRRKRASTTMVLEKSCLLLLITIMIKWALFMALLF